MNTFKLKHRLANDKLMLWTVCLFAALTAVPLLAILGEVLFRGYERLKTSVMIKLDALWTRKRNVQ